MADLIQNLYGHLPIAFQDAVVTRYGRRILRERFGPEYRRLSAFLERSERSSREEQKAYQEERLAALIDHAYRTVPYYHDVMDSLKLRPSDVTTLEDLPRLPMLTRNDVIAQRDRLVSEGAKRRALRKATTSGTTGSPLAVYWDESVSVMNNACHQRTRRWAGFAFGRRYATLMGRVVVPLKQKRPPFWRLNGSWNQLLLSPVHLNAENLPHYVGALREMGVEALEAYPSSAYVLARYLESIGEYLPLDVVFTSAEPLLDFEREIIESRFQCNVFDAYSQTERVMYCSECEKHTAHHVFQEYGILELVDLEGRPVERGTMGHVVATGLHNYSMPLIRYAVGDTATLSDRDRCECGRTLPLLDGVTTKAEDIVVTPDGRMISPSVLTHVFKSVDAAVKSQILQHRPEELLVKLVRRADYRDEHEAAIRRGLAGRIGPQVRIRFDYVDDIPLSGRGKYRRIISTVPLAWGEASAPNLHGGNGLGDAGGGGEEASSRGRLTDGRSLAGESDRSTSGGGA
jgi:phenylacetate-CoA ligase